MALIQCAQNSEFSCFGQINCAQGSTFTFSDEIICGDNAEFKTRAVLNCSDNAEFFMFDAAVYDSLTFHNNVSDTEFTELITPYSFPTLTLYHNGGPTDYTRFITKLNVNKTLGGKTYAEITMVEPTEGSEFMESILALQAQFINPLYNGLCASPFSSPFQTIFPNPLVPNNFNNSVKAYFQLKLAIGYETYQEYTYTNMVPSSWSFDGTEFNIRIEDYTVLLEQEGQSMTPDINSDAGVVRYAQSTIKEICNRYGIPNVVVNFPDFLIRLLRRTEDKPLNWIDMICRIRQAKRKWVGNTLTFAPTLTADEQVPKWNIVEGSHIIDGSFDIDLDLSDYRNRFQIARTSPNGGIIGEQECIGFSCPGRTGNITFDTPVNFATAVYEVTNGDLIDFVYFDANNNPLVDSIARGPDGIYLQSAIPTANVKFTYKPNIGNTSQGNAQQGNANSGVGGMNYGQSLQVFSYTPRYKVTYFGKKNGVSGIDTEYKFTAIDNDGVACLGLRPEYSNIEDSIIPNQGVAVQYAQAMLKEATRKVLKGKLETPFVNPFIEPGDCISITDYELKFINVKWLVEEVIIDLDGDEITMTLNISRGRM